MADDVVNNQVSFITVSASTGGWHLFGTARTDGDAPATSSCAAAGRHANRLANQSIDPILDQS